MLTMTQIQERAPSVFATTPWVAMSEKYRFVPTAEVVNAMINRGFVPVKADQARTRIAGKADFTRHVIRFRTTEGNNAIESARRPGLPVIPEIILMNSHDGTSAYKLMLGMFRMVCCNGLIVCSSMIDEISARHSGGNDLVREVIEGSFKIIENEPKVTAQIVDWQARDLSPEKQLAYATAALELRDTVVKPDPASLLQARRTADKGADIFSTFNRVQENLVRGGIGVRHNRQWRHTRAIKSVNEDAKLNRALWRLTEELAKVA